MKRVTLLFASMFILVLLGACASAPTPTAVPLTATPIPPTPTFTPTATSLPPTPTFTPTATSLPPTPTFTPTATLLPPTPIFTPTATRPVAKTTSGLIYGKVFRSDTNQTISPSSVELDNPNVDPKSPQYRVAYVQTNSDGEYTFLDVKPSEYIMSGGSLYTSRLSLPCGANGSGPALNPDGLEIVLWTVPGSIYAVEAISKAFTIKAGETLTKNFDLFCK